MADQKLTELAAVTSLSGDDLLYAVDDPAGVPTSKKITAANLLPFYPADGRLTLESGIPVSTSNQTAKTTLYYTPYKGDCIALFDGTQWSIVKFSEISIAIPNTSNQMYDVFCYNNAGTATLELLAWTNDTTRATAITRQNGVLCKDGALTRRYLGSIRTTGTSGKCEDSAAVRFVWNYYNRITRYASKVDTTSHTYNGAYRYWNNDTANKLEFIIGVVENIISWNLSSQQHPAADNKDTIVTISINATPTGATTPFVQNWNIYWTYQGVGSSSIPSLGYTYYAIGQYSDNNATFNAVILIANIFG